MTDLVGKTAIVFGADAIGGGIAVGLARAGARLTVFDVDVARAEAVTADIADARAIAVTLGDSASLIEAVRATCGADILVNNPLPAPRPAALETQATAHFTEAFAAVQAAALVMQAVFPEMKARGGGRIINIGHRYGEAVNEGIAPYNAAAWALVGLTRTAAVDWGQHQIATNLLLPFADTPELADARLRRPKVIDLLTNQLALGRAGDPIDDIGGAALFLASDDARWINGQTIYADGGQSIAGPVLNPVKFAT